MSDEISVDVAGNSQAAGVRLLKNKCSHGTTIGSKRVACEPPDCGRETLSGRGRDGRGRRHL